MPISTFVPAVNTASPIPVYHQIVRAFHGAVEAGVLSPGDTVPNPTDLADTLRISRPTTHRAYRTLLHERVLIRTHRVHLTIHPNAATRRKDTDA